MMWPTNSRIYRLQKKVHIENISCIKIKTTAMLSVERDDCN